MNKIATKIKENKWLLLVLLIGSFLRFYKLDFQSLWLDELYTMNVANPKNSYKTIVDEVFVRESFPYFYFFIENLFFKVFGYYSVVARIPSAILGSLSLFFLYKLIITLYNKNAAIIGSILLAINQFHIYYSQEARAYSFYVFGVILSFYFLIKLLLNPNIKNLIGYIIAGAFLMNSNFFSIINLFSQGVIFLLYIICTKENKNLLIKYIFISYGVIAVFFIPNITKVAALLKFDSGWIPPPTKDGITKIFYEFFKNSEFIVFFISLIFLYYVVNLFKLSNVKSFNELKNNKIIFSFLILLIWIFTIVFVNVYKSYTSNSVYISRYFSSLLPAIIIIIAIGFAQIKNKIIRISLTGVFVIFSLLDLLVINKYYVLVEKTQFREISNYIINNNKENYPIYSSVSWFYPFYFKDNLNYKIYDKKLESLVNEMMQDSTKRYDFWYTDAHNNTYSLDENQEAFLNKNYTVENSVDYFDSWAKLYIRKTNHLQKLKMNESSITDNSQLNYWIESFESDNSALKISGWAFLKDKDSYNSNIKIVLMEKNSYKFPVEMKRRQDVTAAHSHDRFNYDNSGFTAEISLEKVPEGNYKVGILIKNNEDVKIIITDKQISK